MEKTDFESKIGKAFTVQLAGEKRVELTLVSVDPLKKIEGVPEMEGGLKAREQPFSLVFSGPEEWHLSDNSYIMKTEGWEDQQIFISAFKSDGKGNIHYDSVFT